MFLFVILIQMSSHAGILNGHFKYHFAGCCSNFVFYRLLNVLRINCACHTNYKTNWCHKNPNTLERKKSIKCSKIKDIP